MNPGQNKRKRDHLEEDFPPFSHVSQNMLSSPDQIFTKHARSLNFRLFVI